MIDQSLLDEPFLRAQWGSEYEAFENSPASAALLARLSAWAARQQLNERSTETAFIQRFFVETWDYNLQGDEQTAYTCRPQYEIAGAGQTGGTGFADLALGNFGEGGDDVPQVLCEFKDIRSGLDARQSRKANNRSPVEQCFDYMQSAWQARDRDSLTEPAYAIVSDMNEFRLYARRLGRAQYQRFVIADTGSETDPGLLTDSPTAAFRRFVFWRLLQPDMLLADRGAPEIDRLLRDQVTREKTIEKEFYREYHDFRQFVYRTLVEANPGFQGTRGRLVRLTQQFLDRCIFVLFCEDMGRVLRYPPQLLRDLLIEESQSRFYNPDGSHPWDAMRALFRAMRDGGHFGPHAIDRFNGGLFEEDHELDSLHIPAKVFCAAGQATAILSHPRTLLYFSGAYNFGLRADAGTRAISLYTLGRIFEQSITELEIMEAEADGRVSLNRLSKRKTDGVYYTPEWVVRMIVDQTLGTRFDDIKVELGIQDLSPLDEAAIAEYRAYKSDRRRTARTAAGWLDFLRSYRFRLDRLRIVDPACGSGAFLIQALNRLVEEYRWVIAEQQRIEGHASLFDQDEVIRSILANNIYGVDINPESVEITKLALWLHTATPGKPLCELDNNIRCGNSLVGPDFAEFYRQRHETLFEQVDENERERINAFDWHDAFEDVFSHGGFDCVIGNPPYIKLQHFRRAQADVAAYLVDSKSSESGLPIYASTQNGNFDMYLPFIEKGISLLCPEGRMGFIAPNVWMVNKYGRSLRQKIHDSRALDRWLDFKSYQVFEEAITYTALQFFRGIPSDALACAFAPDGNAAAIDWKTADRIAYDQLPQDEAWIFAPEAERQLIDCLIKNCKPLVECCESIVVGLQTSADSVYHLKRITTNLYETRDGHAVAIEDGIMHPLISGSDAKRYQTPQTDTHILFPYANGDSKNTRLYTAEELQNRFPLGWNYLKTCETLLRKREGGKFDDEQWFRFGRNQNIDKQEYPKLLVPRLITRLFCTMDLDGVCYLDNVDVGGVLSPEVEQLQYLAAIINNPVCNFVWRRTSKPFLNDYRSANKQFIAPLPIPATTPEEQEEVGQSARELQDLHTQRRDTILKLEQRLNSAQTVAIKPALKPEWIWSDIGSPVTWKQSPMAPSDLSGSELTKWANEQYEEALLDYLDDLDALLQPGVALSVHNTDDELTLTIGGRPAIRLYDRPDTPFIAAQWRHALRDTNVTEAFNGKRLLKLLLDLRSTNDGPIRDRILILDDEITRLDETIAVRESAINVSVWEGQIPHL